MTVVLDSNVLLPVLSLKHSFKVIREAWMQGALNLAFSNEILFEYQARMDIPGCFISHCGAG